MDGNITITKKKLLSLCIDKERLTRLERGGVENWDWYGASLNPDGEPTMDEWEENEYERIYNL